MSTPRELNPVIRLFLEPMAQRQRPNHQDLTTQVFAMAVTGHDSLTYNTLPY